MEATSSTESAQHEDACSDQAQAKTPGGVMVPVNYRDTSANTNSSIAEGEMVATGEIRK